MPHTSGPWSIPNNSQFYVSNGASWVACAVGIRGEEGEANARLIAAAPEMLAALKGLITFAEEVEAVLLIGDEGCLWPVEAARAAIAKAELQS